MPTLLSADTYGVPIFSPSQTLEFLNANETDRPVTIRTNTLKTRRKDLQQSL